MSHAGNRYVRRVLWMVAIMAVNNVPEYHEYLQRRTQQVRKRCTVLLLSAEKFSQSFMPG